MPPRALGPLSRLALPLPCAQTRDYYSADALLNLSSFIMIAIILPCFLLLLDFTTHLKVIV